MNGILQLVCEVRQEGVTDGAGSVWILFNHIVEGYLVYLWASEAGYPRQLAAFFVDWHVAKRAPPVLDVAFFYLDKR